MVKNMLNIFKDIPVSSFRPNVKRLFEILSDGSVPPPRRCAKAVAQYQKGSVKIGQLAAVWSFVESLYRSGIDAGVETVVIDNRRFRVDFLDDVFGDIAITIGAMSEEDIQRLRKERESR